MKKSLLLIVSVWLEIFLSYGSVVHTDINPDTTINNSSYSLDIDNNGTVDFSLSALGNSTLGWIRCDAGTDSLNYVLLDNSGSAYVASNAPYSNIGPSGGGYWFQLNSTSPVLYVIGLGGSGGAFTNSYDGYIGFKFHIGAAYHYGWARVSVNTSTMSLTIKEYAYETIAATAVTTDISEINKISHSLIVINDMNLKAIRISLKQDVKERISEVKVYDISGKTIKENANGNSGSDEILIDVASLSTGIYIVEVSTGSFIGRKKIVITR